MNERTEKWCSKCGADRPLTEFHRNRSRPDGLQGICKACMKKCPSQLSRRSGKLSDRVCIVCEQPFKGQPKAKYCGRECQQRRPWHLIKKRESPVTIFQCRGCAEWTVVRHRNAKTLRRVFCSVRCQREHDTTGLSPGGELSHLWPVVVERHGAQCVYCGDEGRLHLDHVLPRSRGGTDEVTNLVPACPSCNCQKWKWTLDEWERLLIEKVAEREKELATLNKRLNGVRSLRHPGVGVTAA